jgi:N-methylhydantoinase B
MGALSRAVPKYAAGDIKGASNHTYIGSYNPARQRETIFYEYPAGGTGGFLEHDGNHALRAYDEGDFASIQPAEAVEIEHALLIEECSLREDSCGDGRHRGGLGMHREVRLLAESGKFSELSDRNIVPPYGVCGGHSAAPNHFYVLRDGQTIVPSPVPGKISGFPMNKGDIAVLESGGGGGYGSALERDPEKVLADLHEGFITVKKAQERYGVVVQGGKVDEAATKQKRALLAAANTMVTVTEGKDVFQDGRRVCVFSPVDIRRLGGNGALIEMISATGAPLRAWIKSNSEIKAGTLPLGPKGRNILMVAPNDKIELRMLNEGVSS